MAIWTVTMEPGARWTLPPAAPTSGRTLYVHRGAGVTLGERRVGRDTGVRVRPDVPVVVRNGPEASEILVLQGRPIGEPVARRGPLVMNTEAELPQAFRDYRRGAFGRWPWEADDPVHSREAGRFAKHADGRVEEG